MRCGERQASPLGFSSEEAAELEAEPLEAEAELLLLGVGEPGGTEPRPLVTSRSTIGKLRRIVSSTSSRFLASIARTCAEESIFL